MVVSSSKNLLKHVAIRGRMAMAIFCLEPILNYFQIENNEKESLIEIFWQFVENQNLGQWAVQIHKNHIVDIILECIDEGKSIPPTSSFCRSPKFLLEIIYKLVDLGMEELYGTPESYSPLTQQYLVDILELTLKNGFSVPPIEPFLRLEFTKEDPWGENVPRKFFSHEAY